jgi:protein-S-isoprenylcysteine O-methyltransferase Ste14
MEKSSNLFGKIIYAITFLLVIPFGLWLWAKNTEQIIRYPAIGSPTVGWLMIMAGGVLMIWGMLALMKFGKGLPMNAFPPLLYVKKGPFRLFRHPIYWGFGILMVGFFILTGMTGGLWLVAPVTILGMIALVLGYERLDLNQRFPGQKLKTIFDLPEHNDTTPDIGKRFTSLFCLMVVLVVGNFLAEELTKGITPFSGSPLDILTGLQFPILTLCSGVLIIITPFILTRNDLLREWKISGIIGLSLSLFISLLLPTIGAQYLLTESSSASHGIFNLLTTPLFLIFISAKVILKQSKPTGIIFGILTISASLIQLIFSRSAILHLGVSAFIFLIASNYERIWLFLKNLTEKIANSWKEWVFGKVRIINHGFYVGFGTFFGIILAGILAGKAYAWAILVFAFVVIVFSALWAQIVDDSEKLKRPYGYYGALIGIVFASLVVWMMGFKVWVIIGVISVVMPWVQAVGRMRCLINGCCHGAKIDNPKIGIRYFHHRSRVCWISDLKGELLHPTQLYAILWLFFVGFVLLALWYNNFSAAFIFGLYLILTGLGRFVEEAYRGEVLTPIMKGLRLYQWTALISVIAGIIMTVLPVSPITIIPVFGWDILWAALIGGAFTTFAMGIDFPYSNARFSRLV